MPKIKRARGYRVYGLNGARYIDFYLNGGRALTGHRPAGVLKALKSGGERGLWAEYPGTGRRRSNRLLMRLFPEVDRVSYFPTLESALLSLSEAAGRPVSIADTPFRFQNTQVPLENLEKGAWVVYRRPWALTPMQEKQLAEGRYGRFFIPLIPFPGSFLPVPVCRVRSAPRTETMNTVVMPREPQEISPILFDLLIKSMVGLQKLRQEDYSPLWMRFDLPGVERVGPYLQFKIDPHLYNRWSGALLKEGVLLPPEQSIPAVVPCEFTEGEVMPLINGCKEKTWKR